MIDAYASHSHLAEHLWPIWDALPESDRGTFWIGARTIYKRVTEHGWGVTFGRPDGVPNPTLVANHQDLTQLHPARPAIFVEHGAGQSYQVNGKDGHPAYSGGTGRGRVKLFLTLNAETARRERERNPDAQVVIVGSPRLDALASSLTQARQSESAPGKKVSAPAVAFCWHWNCGLVPETMWAWPYYRSALGAIARRWQILGHGHPRAFPMLRRAYEQMGIEPVQDFSEVIARADLVVVDNSSAGYEAAALGIRTVWLNAPTYRRDVFHGLRFWSELPGPQVDEPAELEPTLVEMLTAPGSWALRSEAVANRVYPRWTRGKAARLAAEAVGSLTI